MARVLVVEDEPLISMMLADWLGELNCATVGPAANVESALALLGDGPVDAAILDLSLGSGRSYPVAAVLSRQNIPFAFATGRGYEDIDSPFANAPVVSKPFDFETFRGVVGKLLARDLAGS
jgi:DNA-binding response OmpR family regulator